MNTLQTQKKVYRCKCGKLKHRRYYSCPTCWSNMDEKSKKILLVIPRRSLRLA